MCVCVCVRVSVYVCVIGASKSLCFDVKVQSFCCPKHFVFIVLNCSWHIMKTINSLESIVDISAVIIITVTDISKLLFVRL